MNKTATAITLSLALVGSSLAALEANATKKEKCYGVVKAGQNDCATKVSSCVGSSKTDGQTDAFIALPKGLCEKLVNGSLTSS